MPAKHIVVRPPARLGSHDHGATFCRPVEVEYILPEHVSGIEREVERPGELHAEWQRRSAPGPRVAPGWESGPRLTLLTLHVGVRVIKHVQGPLGDLHRRLFGVSPDAAPTGVSVKVLNGAYALAGDGDGDAPATVEAGTSVVLDPDRLTAAGGEWTLTRPAGNPHARCESSARRRRSSCSGTCRPTSRTARRGGRTWRRR